MLKLKFINISDSKDIVILPAIRAHISNFDDNNRWFGSSEYNNKVTIYEQSASIFNYIDNIPSYSELTSSITRKYYYVKDNNLRLTITFSRINDAILAACGGENKINVALALSYKEQRSYLTSLGGGYPLPCPWYTQITNSSHGQGILVYDVENKVFACIKTHKHEIAKVKLPSSISQKVNINNTLIYPYQFEKGDILPYLTPLWSVDGEDASRKTWTWEEAPSLVGKIITQNLGSSSEIEPKRTDGTPSLFTLLEKHIPKYPDGDDDDDFPSGDGDDDSDDINPNPVFPTTATGFVSMYAPTQSELKSLATFMWSSEFLDIILKLMQNPYDAIISIKNVCCDIETGGTSNIILGNVDTKISCSEITRQYQQIDCGTIKVSRYFGNFLDFNPYTSIKIYLPFVGYKELDVDEVMGSTLHLYYNIDLLTGTCVAIINVSKTINGTALNSVLYQFDGMIGTEIPVTSNDYSQVVSALLKGIATTGAAIGITAATGGSGGVLLGSAVASEKATAIGTTMMVNSAIDTVTSKINVQHGGSLGGSMGVLASKQPYLIITRVIPKNPTNYASLHGIPSNAYKKLSSLKGFTKMQDIQIKSTIGSVDETEEIKQLLLNGVVI